MNDLLTNIDVANPLNLTAQATAAEDESARLSAQSLDSLKRYPMALRWTRW